MYKITSIQYYAKKKDKGSGTCLFCTSNIVFTSKLIGTLSVIPMLAMLILYAGWLQKDSFLKHLFSSDQLNNNHDLS